MLSSLGRLLSVVGPRTCAAASASEALLRGGPLLQSVQAGCSSSYTSGPLVQWAGGKTGGGYLGTGPGGQNAEHEEQRFLVTGACGQIGSELIPFLRARVGVENVIASDVKTSRQLLESGPFVYLDVTDKDNLARVMIETGCTHVVHLATLLSAIGERNPQLALRVNTAGIQNVLDLAAQHNLSVYSPSTIAVFGETSPKDMTPNDTVMQPNTMYGITKVHAELLGAYYHQKFNVDFRALRYPGIISYNSPPGGGTTDYAVDIFHQALRTGHYTCFLNKDAVLPMMFMDDCLEATWQLISAPRESLTRCTYNVAAVSFSPEELAEAIRKHMPGFTITYTPDFRDAIARTWPNTIDDSLARQDWGWKPNYDLAAMTKVMLEKVQQRMTREAEKAAAKAASNNNNGGGSSSAKASRASRAAVAAAAVPAHLA